MKNFLSTFLIILGLGFFGVAHAEDVKTNAITKPLLNFSKKVDDFRVNNLSKIQKRQEELKILVQVQPDEDTEKPDVETHSAWTEFLASFKYLEVFLLGLLILILSLKFVFYGAVILILLMVSRFIWYRFY